MEAFLYCFKNGVRGGGKDAIVPFPNKQAVWLLQSLVDKVNGPPNDAALDEAWARLPAVDKNGRLSPADVRGAWRLDPTQL